MAIRKGLVTLVKTQYRVTAKLTRSLSYVVESLGEDYGERQVIEVNI